MSAFNSGTFYSKGDIKVSVDQETFEIMCSVYGSVDERVKDVMVKVSFEPVGEWEFLSVLWPYGATVVGASVFTGTDKPLVIQSVDGKTYTFSAAAVTKMPTITASAIKTLIGEVEFSCLRTNNTAWTGAKSIVTIASNAFSDVSFIPTNVLTQAYSLAWGSSPWASFESKDGVVVDFSLSLNPIETDSEGIVDYRFEKLGVTAKLTPLGVTDANIASALIIQGTGAGRGRSLGYAGIGAAASADLVITGAASGVITVKQAAMKRAGYQFGPVAIRTGELEFVATRAVTAGVLSPLFTVA